MTEDDKAAFKEFRNGFALAIAVVGFGILIIGALSMNNTPINEASFEVVDKYDNRCNVIRYTPENSARYVYFLDCYSK